jgi:hypothetical protein
VILSKAQGQLYLYLFNITTPNPTKRKTILKIKMAIPNDVRLGKFTLLWLMLKTSLFPSNV